MKRAMRACVMGVLMCGLAGAAGAQSVVITQWNFNSPVPDGSSATGSTNPSLGSGTAGTFSINAAQVITTFNSATGNSTDTATTDNTAWEFANSPGAGEPSGCRGAEFAVSTAGFNSVVVTFDLRISSTASRFVQLFYSTNGAAFTAYGAPFEAVNGGDAWYNTLTADFTAVAGVSNNPNFKFRIAPVYAPGSSPAGYAPSTPTGVYGSGGNKYRYDMVTVSGVAPSPTNPSANNALSAPGAVCTTGGTVKLTVNVAPGQNPLSGGLTATANLSAVGGSASFALSDDGTSGDELANDNVFSGTVIVGAGQTVGSKNVPITIGDAQGRSASTSATIVVADCSGVSTSRVVISGVFGGGGNSGPPVAAYNADFIQLYNRSNQTVDLTGWSVQYAGPAATTGFDNVDDRMPLSGVIKPGQHLLLRYSDAGTVGAALPAPDFAMAPGTGGIGNNGGRVALVRSMGLIGTNCGDANIEDFVGYGLSSICHEGAASTNSPDNDTGVVRKGGGAQDTNQNFNDFDVAAPTPLNRTAGGFIAGYSAASAADVCIGTPVVFSVAVTPGQSPASTGVSVRADLTAIGGSAAAVMFDDGTHGDAAGGDGVYTLSYVIPGATVQGTKSIAFTTSDAQSRTDVSYVTFKACLCVPSSATVVISQYFTGGGNVGSPFAADYVEIFNRSGASVNLGGWSLQYADASASNAFLPAKQVNLSGSIGAGEYRLIQCGATGASGGVLPTPDFVAVPAFGMDNQFGKIALVSSVASLGTNCSSASIVDLVGYSRSASCFEGLDPAGAMNNGVVAYRKENGCEDFNQNAIDFDLIAPIDLPRNAASAANACVQAPVSGACCTGSHCTVTTSAACGGSFQGASSVCGAAGNPTTCCKANFNQTGGVSVQDIFDFLTAWFAGAPASDVNGVGGITVQDIFDFLGFWFAGC